MASLSDRQNSSDFFESRSPRTSPRPSENAPVLFRLPNMRIDAPHGAKTAEKGTFSDSRADQVRNENDNLGRKGD